MEIRALRYVVALAEELHFGRAARRLYIAEQPFGLQIRRLEEEIGVKIFERTSRRVSLTPAGALVVSQAREILGGVDRLAVRATVAADLHAHFRLGILGFGAAGHWPTIRSMLEAESSDLVVDYVDLDFSRQHQAVTEGAVDAGIVQFVGPVPGLRFEKLFSSRRVVVVPADSKLAESSVLQLADLRDQAWLSVPSSGDSFAQWLGPIGTELSGAPVVAHPASIPAAVATTGRLCLHAEMAAEYYPHPGVRFVPLDGEPLEIAIATREGDERPAILSLYKSAQHTHVAKDWRGHTF